MEPRSLHSLNKFCILHCNLIMHTSFFSEYEIESGLGINCLVWYTTGSEDTAWMEQSCISYDLSCPCQYEQQPVLRLRGLCEDSLIYDYIFSPKQLPGFPLELVLQGGLSLRIRYNDSSSQWVLSDSLSSVTAVTRAAKKSYVLGKHEWTVTGDVYDCHKGEPYTTYLKMSGCNPWGEFTCNDGQCVTIEERCNQIPNCRDESDEVDCKLIVLKENYNKKVPPIIPTGENKFNQTRVDISIVLLKIVSMEEVQHKINFQFGIILEWEENRVKYHNLKMKKSLNALTDAEIKTLWLPYVIYANTDMKEAVQLKLGLKTTIVVNRKGNFTVSDDFSIMDEIEIFEGSENTLAMYQTYTKRFQCQYHLQRYPFDTQVNKTYILLQSVLPCIGVFHRNDD